jgi:AraC-like DNA-binding protein
LGYIEYPVASPIMCCTWEQWAEAAHEQRVVPDACVDLVWSDQALTIAGPDTRARLIGLTAGSRVVGVRLHPGAAGAVLGLPASELCDATPTVGDVLGLETAERLLDELHGGGDPHAALRRAVERLTNHGPDPLVRAAIVALDRPDARVGAVADGLGVSARQLQRRVSDAVGYGPKVLARILRFRRLQSLAAAGPGADARRAGGRDARPPLVELALDAGYADQAHMTTEVTRLAGISPVRFFKDRTPRTA